MTAWGQELAGPAQGPEQGGQWSLAARAPSGLPSPPLEVWAAEQAAPGGEPALCQGLVGVWALGPQNRMLRASRASGASRELAGGAPAELAEAQWSRLAPMQAA